MPYYLINIDVVGFKSVVWQIAMTTATASTLAAGVTKVVLRNSTAVVTCMCEHKKLIPVFKTLNHINYHNALRSETRSLIVTSQNCCQTAADGRLIIIVMSSEADIALYMTVQSQIVLRHTV